MFKKIFQKRQGFTLVELMIVIVIIGVLTTLIIVSLDNTKMTARNTRRLADIKQIQLALKMYYNDTGMFPTSITPGSSISKGGANYMLRVPSNPKPWADNGCPDQDYQYVQLEGGKRYVLTFCVGDTTDDLSKGSHIATSNGILNCPTGYIPIPGSAELETNDFCVMKYEAKCANSSTPTVGLSIPIASNSTYNNSAQPCTGSYIPVSTSSGFPIGNITHALAKTYCQNIGARLINNAEWMTIARNVEQEDANWWDQEVDGGSLDIGNYGLGSSGDVMDGSLQNGSGGSSVIYNRDLILSTGDTIKDLSGNVAEWVDNQCTPGAGIGNYDSTGSFIVWSHANLNDYERAIAGPSNSTWGNPDGVGQYKGCTVANNVFVRGGSLYNDTGYNTGIFNLDLSLDGTTPNTLIGFRCVK